MGNAKSTSCSNSTSVTEQDLKITDYDITIYEHRKERIFKGTIAICIVYAFIALLILLTSYMYPTIKFIIFEKFLPFTIVFIVGTILLIVYLFYNILYFKPIKINKNFDYTNISCPDYWKLEYNPELHKYFDSNSINTNIFNYRCVLDSNIFSKTDLYFNQKNKYVADSSGVGTVDTNGTRAIGMTGFNYNQLMSYSSVSKDSIDTDNSKYIVADLKADENKDILNKITGLADSNVYKNLVESSLLMNNYYFDSNISKNKDYNIYKHISQATLANTDMNGFDDSVIREFNSSKENDYDLKFVASDTKKNTSSAPLANTNTIAIKKNITDGTTNYLENIVLGNNSYNNPINAFSSSGTLEKFPIVCNRVYPLLLAAKDKELSKNSSGKYDENVLRCAYSKMCGIPWSDMNCDKYDT
jgi:hypothetical protein